MYWAVEGEWEKVRKQSEVQESEAILSDWTWRVMKGSESWVWSDKLSTDERLWMALDFILISIGVYYSRRSCQMHVFEFYQNTE